MKQIKISLLKRIKINQNHNLFLNILKMNNMKQDLKII